MTDRELMQQALHTLEGWANHGKWVWPESALEQAKRNTTESITALRERLAQPEQEPMAWVCYGSASDEKHTIDYQQEDIDAVPVGTMLYTSPSPRREWVGLTDSDKAELDEKHGDDTLAHLDAIEAKLKEKNT